MSPMSFESTTLSVNRVAEFKTWMFDSWHRFPPLTSSHVVYAILAYATYCLAIPDVTHGRASVPAKSARLSDHARGDRPGPRGLPDQHRGREVNPIVDIGPHHYQVGPLTRTLMDDDAKDQGGQGVVQFVACRS